MHKLHFIRREYLSVLIIGNTIRTDRYIFRSGRLIMLEGNVTFGFILIIGLHRLALWIKM